MSFEDPFEDPPPNCTQCGAPSHDGKLWCSNCRDDLHKRVALLEEIVLDGGTVPPKGLCFWCARNYDHAWHDNGTWNRNS